MSDIILRASSVRSFHETPSTWYKNHILGLDKFEGNTATYLGTIVHHFAECYFTGMEKFDPEAILEDAPEHVDKEVILDEYEEMCKVFEARYLDSINEPDQIEMYSKIEVDGITFQGTCDAIQGTTLVDYKTSSKAKSKMDEYIQQLNIYAYFASTKDIKIDKLRVVNITRKTKTLPPRIIVLECDADVEMGKRLIDLMVRKTRLALDNPEFRELIFGENNYSFLSDGFGIDTEVTKLE